MIKLELRPELLSHPNIPKPLHGLSPRSLMGKRWWDEKRWEAYAKLDYCCWACGTFAPYDVVNKRFEENKLHAHESYVYDYTHYSLRLDEIVALCPICHDYIHSGRMNVLYDKDVIDEAECWVIRSHGDRVLTDAGLEPTKYCSRNYVMEWSQWHLIIDDKAFYSKFANETNWKEYYGRKDHATNK